MELTIVTKNKYKVESKKKVLEKAGIELKVEDFFVPEIQSETCEEVAAFSAKYAANFAKTCFESRFRFVYRGFGRSSRGIYKPVSEKVGSEGSS